MAPPGPRVFKDFTKIGGWLRRVDRNHDGVITGREFAKAARRFFDRLDRDDDGRIMRGEFAKDRPTRLDDGRMKYKDKRLRKARAVRPLALAE